MNKELVALDIEVVPNYFLVVLKRLSNGKVVSFECKGREESLSIEDRRKLHNLLSKYTTFGFNSEKFDMVVLHLIIAGYTCYNCYEATQKIITTGQAAWMSYRNFGITKNGYDHFDIAEPSPAVMISLKNYGTRVGSKVLKEFFVNPDEDIVDDIIPEMHKYCINDVNVTIDLYNAIKDRIDLRVSMSKQYGLDLRSKSDAQIAEAVVTHELSKKGVKAITPKLDKDYSVKYKVPEFIAFESDILKETLELIKASEFRLGANGAVLIPKDLQKHKIKIGKTVYKLGIGGLHSQEKSLSVYSDENNVMRNADFTSYYPYIILNQGLYPKHLTKVFLDIYREIVETRLKAKAEKNMIVADSLKITINGSFGKFGSKYSKLYSPDLLLQTTITGQLTLLMLIEQLEKNNIPVVSANTDGLEYLCPKDKIALAEAIIFDLELVTGFEMEHGTYVSLHSRDVNNYVAVYNGYTKAKGVYADTTLSKGRSTPIVFTAIREYLLNATPIDESIYACKDINQFVAARTVKGGGQYDGEYLGKMVRWYYSNDSKGCISYVSNGNKVPKTDGCKPMMNLTDNIPADLNYNWYIVEAIENLKDLGVDYGK